MCAGVLLICLCDVFMMRCVMLYGLFFVVVYVCVRGLMCLCDMCVMSCVMLYDVCFVCLGLCV